MKTLAFAVPIVTGKTEEGRRFAGEIAGPRYKEMGESRRAKRLTRETLWIQPTPMGDYIIVYFEGEDAVRANEEFAASKTPFDVWFKKEAGALVGQDFNQPLPKGFVEVIYETPASGQMNSFALALPILPGKTEVWRHWAAELTGSGLADFEDYRHRAGLTKENLYLEHSPAGDIAIYYVEGEHPAEELQRFAISNHPFDVESKRKFLEHHGIDFSQPAGPLPELGYDWKA
jgi:hypothetical protein